MGMSLTNPGAWKTAQDAEAYIAAAVEAQGGGGVKKLRPGGRDFAGGSEELKYTERRRKSTEEEYAKFVEDNKKSLDVVSKNLSLIASVFEQAGSMNIQAGEAAGSLTDLAVAAREATVALGGKVSATDKLKTIKNNNDKLAEMAKTGVFMNKAGQVIASNKETLERVASHPGWSNQKEAAAIIATLKEKGMW
jgi:hypothetical protein